MIAIRFVINKIKIGIYWTGDKSKQFTAYIGGAKTFKTYSEAEAELLNLPEDFYQIDKVFKVKNKPNPT